MRSLSHRLTASVAAAALGLGVFAATPRVASASTLDDKTTFLGIEGADEQIVGLSDALRWDLNQRGMDDGNTMTLAELKLTLGCGDGDFACFAQGGEAIGSNELVFGTALKQGTNYLIVLNALDVSTGELKNKVERTVSFVDLSEAQLGATAASLIDELYGLSPAPEEVVEVDETEEPEEVEPEGPPPGSLVWGPYSPRPGWKYAGVGISGVLMVGGVALGAVSAVRAGPNGSIERQKVAEAETSLLDDKPSNDVDPSAADLCAIAENPPNPDRPDEVANAAVTQLCIKQRNTQTMATVGWISAAVFGVSTIAFTTLLFVHKTDSKTAAKLLKRKVSFGGSPLRDGGFMVGGQFSF